MATLVEVLAYHPDYAGLEWSWRGDADVYDGGIDEQGKQLGLTWLDAAPAPTEVELDSKRAATDAIITALNREKKARQLLTSEKDHLMAFADAVADAIVEMQTIIANQGGNVTEATRMLNVQSKIATLKQRAIDEA